MDSLFFSVMAVLANADLIPFLIALLIGIPSAVLYCLELAVIVTNFAEFGAPFFVLVAVRAASSLVNYVFSFLAQRFGKIGLFFPVYLKLPRVVLAFGFNLSNLGVLPVDLVMDILSKVCWRRRFGFVE
uniref:Uncharacterized protein n=1 Tax=Globodera rostochiensis TaxID=31243 RepID=A0A914HS14_GLORO